MLQIQAMAAVQDELGPKSVTVLVTWVDGQVHFEVRAVAWLSFTVLVVCTQSGTGVCACSCTHWDIVDIMG
jgi:hypothetical protein